MKNKIFYDALKDLDNYKLVWIKYAPMKNYLIRFKDESLYNWLKSHSQKIGETMSSIIRRALKEYKERN